MNSTSLDQAVIQQLKQWPWREAKALQKTLRSRKPKSGKVLFETGFGPSGLPHIGTFAEVARTTWVRRAFELLTGEETELYAFSDNMDGLRKVPSNLPNAHLIEPHLNKPLCRIPDPFGTHASFSGHMNAKLQEFLDHFGFDYTFKASDAMYTGGVFNEGLVRILERYDAVRDVILPTLSEEKRDAWSPFFPICTACGRVNGTEVVATFPERGSLAYRCTTCGHEGEVPVTDGHVKVGWKVDWALRWFTFGVNYEMYGKDLIDSYTLSSKICRIMGEEPPLGMFYELFLGKDGEKISKTKGNGLTIDEWLQYGPLRSLTLFIFKRPDQASRLFFEVIPQHVDEYLMHLGQYPELPEGARQLNSPIWFLHHQDVKAGALPSFSGDLNFATLLNLVTVLNTDDPDIVWEYILRYRPEAEQDRQVMDELVARALAYYRTFILPTKVHTLPSEEFRPAVDALLTWLEGAGEASAEAIQTAAYAAGNEAGVNLREFFKAMYRLLLGQEQGPRLGTFIQLYGVQATLDLARQKIAELEAAPTPEEQP